MTNREAATITHQLGERVLDGLWLENETGAEQAALTIEWRFTMGSYRRRGLSVGIMQSGYVTLCPVQSRHFTPVTWDLAHA